MPFFCLTCLDHSRGLYGMAPAHVLVFLSQKLSNEIEMNRLATLFLAWAPTRVQEIVLRPEGIGEHIVRRGK